MKTIIEKRADQLQPGDIIVRGPHEKYCVLAVGDSIFAGSVRIVAGCIGDRASSGVRSHDYDAFVRISVEVPELTLAQQHADELVEILREVRDDHEVIGFGINRGRRTDELLAKLAPPPPPTAEELADMLREMLLPAQGPDTIVRAKEMLRRRGGK